jgi:hypothetical protein
MPLVASFYINCLYRFHGRGGSCNFHGAILPEARVSHVPLYNASSILVSVKTRLSIFVEQGKCIFEFFIKVSCSFLWTTALIQQWPGLVLRASTSWYPTVIRPSTLAGWAGFDGHLAADINAFYPFHVAFPFFGDASSEMVLPSVKLHGRVDVFVGRFTRPSQAGRFDSTQRPRRTNHEMLSCVLRSAIQRENRSLRRWIIPLCFIERLRSL